MNYHADGKNVVLTDYSNFNLHQTLFCGQAFRFYERDGIFEGMAGERFISMRQKKNEIIFYNTSTDVFENFFINYFDLNRNYHEIIQYLSADETLKKACEFSNGIRIMNQDIWETVCTFIISQNNNIPRIRGITERLCSSFGEKITGGYSFPSAEKIASLTESELAPLRAGFRNKYILDAAVKLSEKSVNTDIIPSLPLDEAKAELEKIKGIGDKVASCILLFSFGRMDALPKDVWIKRALNYFYGKEAFPDFVTEKGYGGIAQQYLFHYARTNASEIFSKK